ncbi:GntR family transcriptional regulator [Salipiger mucosus]|uniref:Transcriptional regulator, GntR family n=1 Tax=Salipiger mucosus DSM 16094 TaxID=1123237 RepID=S9RPA7_9RHOB|nr:GntR family transcriptional regulator [Salipiger mucosus]EPX75859.1 Transcriptional regulator, GntR family [Salipiger mucosus DSM 16094]
MLVAQIERDISSGELHPGGWLKQNELQEKYNTTRLAIRQALDHLTVSGSIVHRPNRGYQVQVYDEKRIRDISLVRAALEVATLDDIIRNITDESMERLKVLAEEFRVATVQGTASDRIEANSRYHAELMSNCDNTELVELALSYRSKLPTSVQEKKNTPLLMAKSADEHFKLIDSLKARNLDEAKRLLWVHIMGFYTDGDEASSEQAKPKSAGPG